MLVVKTFQELCLETQCRYNVIGNAFCINVNISYDFSTIYLEIDLSW